MDPVLLTIAAYVLAQLAIGVLVSRRVHTEDDYLLAGRRLGYPLAVFSIFATWFGAEACIGAAGTIYRSGLAGGRAEPFGYAACLLVMGLFFARRLWKRKYTTVADLFRDRYSPAVERTAALVMVPGSILWAAAQIRAFGQVLSATGGIEIAPAVTLAAVVVVLYTFFGGLLADAVTDLVQGAVLIGGLITLTAVVVAAQGGVEAAFLRIDPERLAFGIRGRSWLETAETWAIPIFGSVMAQELIQRVLASRSEHVATRATLLATGLYLGIGLLPVALGLLGPAILPNLADPEQLLPSLARHHLPTFAYALFAGALVSAILSTVDSTLLVASSLLSHNVVSSLRPDLGERTRLRLARGGVLLSGAIAYVIALSADGVYLLVEEASSFGSGGLFAIFLLGLYGTVGHTPSAIAALATGVVVSIAGNHVVDFPAPFLTSVIAAFAAYFVFAPFGSRMRRSDEILEPAAE